MYSMKAFYDFCPQHLLSQEDKSNIETIRLAYDRVDKANEGKHHDPKSGFPREGVNWERLSDKEVELRNSLVNKSVFAYVNQAQVEDIKSLNEAINDLYTETSRVYGWYKDVKDYQDDLEELGRNKHSDRYSQNYWYFMEWQSDCFSVLDSLVYLNGGNIPKLSLTKEEIKENFSILCGCRKLTNKKDLVEEVISLLETAYAWAYDEDENSWIIKSMDNSHQESFEKHVEIFVRLLRFIDKNVEDGEFPEIQKSYDLLNDR